MAGSKAEPRVEQRGAPALPDVGNSEFEPKRKRTWPYAFALLLAWILIAAGVLVEHWISQVPDINELLRSPPSRDITLLDRHGQLIARRGLAQGAVIPLTQLPLYVPDAFIAIEDRRFRDHIGLDIIGVARAALENMAAGHVVQGGSTITQQLAKNLFLASQRTFKRKTHEALLALYLESRYSKDQILTLYLNHVYFGAGAYGVEAASERFFGKKATALTLPEAAMLAGLMKAPTKFNPLVDPDAAHARAVVVLHAMAQAGFIDHQTMQEAASARPKVIQPAGTPDSGYFADWVAQQLDDLVGEVHEPLLVETTFDLAMQASAEHAVENALLTQGAGLNVHQAALVALAPDGAIRAMVGGRSYADSPYNRATDAHRQPGSAFKPFVYLAALEHGRTPADLVNDAPFSVRGWKPENYEDRYDGEISLARAFAKSSNSVAAQLAVEVGPARVARVAHRLGIASPLSPVPSLALGTSAVTPLELTGAYVPFANGGHEVIPFDIVNVRTKSGRVLYRHSRSKISSVMSLANAAALTRMMADTLEAGTGKAARLDGRPSAGKTGTTQDFRDAWFVGFTADLICGVWTGNDDDSPMRHVTGGTFPARIFKSFMEDAEYGLPARPLTSLKFGRPLPTAAVASQAAANVTPQQQPVAFEDILETLTDAN